MVRSDSLDPLADYAAPNKMLWFARVQPLHPGIEMAERDRLLILVAEDEPATAAMVQAQLESAGFDVAVRADGAAAWLAYSQIRPDLLVADIQMPIMDGDELVRRVLSYAAHFPIVVFSASPEQALLILYEHPKARIRFVSKPWTSAELESAIRSLLQQG